MMKWVRQGFLGLLLFVVGAVVVTAVLRWFAVDDAARADVALLMTPPPAPVGDNGFAALALAGHEVPVDQFEAVMAGEVARFEAFERATREELLAMARKSPYSLADGGPSYTLLEDSGFPVREPLDYSVGCGMQADDCLARVGEDPGAVRDLLARAGERTALAERSLASGHLRNPYPPSLMAPLPSFQLLRLPLNAAALDAVEGRVPEAMSRTCGVLANARRHGATSTDLIPQMVMASLANGAAGLLLDLRRAAPDVPLPADCAPALAPVQGEDYFVCEAIRGEFRMVSRVSHDLDASLAGKWNPRDLFLRLTAFDADTYDAWLAPRYAQTCRDDYRQAVLAGVVPPPRVEVPEMSDPTCWGAVVSCVLSNIGMADVGQYQRRLLDNAAKLRLQLAALAVADGRLARDAAVAEATSPGYAATLSADGDRLQISLQQAGPNQEPTFSVAL
ncbi:hypothetical protein [Arenimonas sp.]|uniref:hypothetical protein n=1 Tax=Arenimonas sp. TaxID=1872635 RepID=UPI0025B7BF28|nr:hypothetical protein [Arenimonas sp.]